MGVYLASIVVSSKIKMNVINLALSRRVELTKVQETSEDLVRFTFENIPSHKVMKDMLESINHIYEQSFKKKERP